MIFVSQSRKADAKSIIICENDYSRLAIFEMFDRVVNMPRALNAPEF